MASIVVPGLDLAPSVPSRIVTVDVIDMTEGRPAAGAHIDFILPQDLHARADGKVLKAGTTRLTLDSQGHGEIRVPAYSSDTKPADWVILVKKSWAPHAYPIRVAPGTTAVSLATLEPPVEVNDLMAKYLLTDASATIAEGSQWGVNVTKAGNIANFAFTAPPGGEAYWKGGTMLSASTDLTTLTPGVYIVGSHSTAELLNLPAACPGAITSAWVGASTGSRLLIFQTLEGAGEPSRIFTRGRISNQWSEWAELQPAGGPANAKRGIPAAGASTLSPDLWTSADQGVWDIRDIANLTPMVRDGGYTPPSGFAPHQLHHLEHSVTGEAVQIAWVGGNRHRALWRQRRYGQTQFDAWEGLSPTPLGATITDQILAIGDSWVEGGELGSSWSDGSEWPAKLQQELGVTVTNAGKGGAGSDEVALRLGAKSTWLKISGGQIPASGSAPVQLSWTPAMQTPRWFSQAGKIKGAAVALEQNGTTGAWTIRRITGTQIADGQAVAAADWVEWVSDLEDTASQRPIIIRVGTNDRAAGVVVPRPTTADHTVATISEIVESRPYRAHACILLGLVPHVGDTSSKSFTDAVNARLKARFPRQFWDVLAYMQDTGPTGALADCGLTPTQEDTSLIAQGFPPRSLYSAGETVHPGKKFHAALAGKLASFIRSRGIVR